MVPGISSNFKPLLHLGVSVLHANSNGGGGRVNETETKAIDEWSNRWMKLQSKQLFKEIAYVLSYCVNENMPTLPSAPQPDMEIVFFSSAEAEIQNHLRCAYVDQLLTR